MTIPDKLYNWLKWICLICLPAVDTFLLTVLPALGVADNLIKTIVTIISAVGTLIGALIGVSTAGYNKKPDGE